MNQKEQEQRAKVLASISDEVIEAIESYFSFTTNASRFDEIGGDGNIEYKLGWVKGARATALTFIKSLHSVREKVSKKEAAKLGSVKRQSPSR